MSSDVPEEYRPRLCHIVKWPEFPGYGFNLHAEKGKAGQFIGQVDDGSPSQAGGLKEGDRIVEVNGINIGNENHQQVVTRIKSGGEETRLLVVDNEADNWYKEQKRVVKGDSPEVRFLSARRDAEPAVEPEPSPEPDAEAFQESVTVADNGEVEHPPPPAEVEDAAVVAAATAATNGESQTMNEDQLHRPRHCHLKIWPHFQGYGFNLHAERDKPGQYIGLVDTRSPAEAAGLRVNDRIVEVNGANVENQAHPEVIGRIKAVPNETRLLVVDRTCDAYYKERGITVHSGMSQVDYIVTPDIDGDGDTSTDAEAAVASNGSEAAVVATEAVSTEEPAPPAAAVEEEEAKPEQESEPAAAPEENAVNEEENGAKEEEVVAKEEDAAPPAEEEHVKQEEEEAAVAEPVNGVSSAPTQEPEPVPEPTPVPEPEPEFAVAPTPAPAPVPTPAPAPTATSANLDGLELNLSVAEMKERLKSRKKQDPRTSKMTFEQKYKDFQRM